VNTSINELPTTSQSLTEHLSIHNANTVGRNTGQQDQDMPAQPDLHGDKLTYNPWLVASPGLLLHKDTDIASSLLGSHSGFQACSYSYRARSSCVL
jgi:hypothetical protein